MKYTPKQKPTKLRSVGDNNIKDKIIKISIFYKTNA